MKKTIAVLLLSLIVAGSESFAGYISSENLVAVCLSYYSGHCSIQRLGQEVYSSPNFTFRSSRDEWARKAQNAILEAQRQGKKIYIDDVKGEVTTSVLSND